MVTTESKKALESHILNGRANMNYNFEQFSALTPEQKTSYLWSAIVHADLMNEIKSDTITPETYKQIFARVQSVSKKAPAPVANISGRDIFTSAQGMTLLGYGDSNVGGKNAILCRSLDYLVECNDLTDLMSCLRIIDSYNEFDAHIVCNALKTYAAKKSFYGETNPNNENDRFKFKVGRQSSPVFYVRFSEYLSPKVEVSRNGAEVEYRLYTGQDFKVDMSCLSDACKCDSFDIQEGELTGTAKYYTARFWFD